MTPPKNQAAQMLVITMFVELRPHRRMVHGTRPLILSRHGSQGLAQAIAAGEIRLQGNIQQWLFRTHVQDSLIFLDMRFMRDCVVGCMELMCLKKTSTCSACVLLHPNT